MACAIARAAATDPPGDQRRTVVHAREDRIVRVPSPCPTEKGKPGQARPTTDHGRSGFELVQDVAVPGSTQQWAGEDEVPTQGPAVPSQEQGATQLLTGSGTGQIGAETA
jgi:hypothetical protein